MTDSNRTNKIALEQNGIKYKKLNRTKQNRAEQCTTEHNRIL